MGYVRDLKSYFDNELNSVEYTTLVMDKIDANDVQYWAVGLYMIACTIGGTVWIGTKIAKLLGKRKAR